MAMIAYLEAIDLQTASARKNEIRRELLAYCGLDTYALARLWQHFAGRHDIRVYSEGPPVLTRSGSIAEPGDQGVAPSGDDPG